MQIIIRELLLDHMPLLAAADNEIMKSKVGIILHDMPQNGLIADLDHGFRLKVTLLADAGAQAARQNNNLHLSFLISLHFEKAISSSGSLNRLVHK